MVVEVHIHLFWFSVSDMEVKGKLHVLFSRKVVRVDSWMDPQSPSGITGGERNSCAVLKPNTGQNRHPAGSLDTVQIKLPVCHGVSVRKKVVILPQVATISDRI